MNKDPFKEYIKQSEPSKRDKGDISIDEAQELLNTYYEENPKADTGDRTEEADKVAVRIAKILSEKAFSFTPNEYISIHKRLYTGIYGHAGKLRDYNITKKNAWYFRNALVRANYNDLKNGVHETTEYLELFLRNLLLDEKNELHNRFMHISEMFEKADIENTKVNIESTKVDIESTKVDIRNRLLSFSEMISEKTIHYVIELFSKCGKKEYFGRTIVEEVTGLKSTRASELIKMLVDSEVIVPVTGHGKGKYRF